MCRGKTVAKFLMRRSYLVNDLFSSVEKNRVEYIGNGTKKRTKGGTTNE